MVQNNKYTFSFTGASALIAETLVIAEEYEKLKDWQAVEKSVLEHNLLNKIKQATFKREFSELKKRLILLTPAQLHLMINGSFDEAKAMVLLALLKFYAILKDFIVEVLLNKYLLFDNVLTETDYTRFINSKSSSHPELIAITDNTAKKVKQVMFKLLEQVGLITHAKNGIILKPVLSNEVLVAIILDDPALLSSFLYSSEEIKSLLLKLNHAQ